MRCPPLSLALSSTIFCLLLCCCSTSTATSSSAAAGAAALSGAHEALHQLLRLGKRAGGCAKPEQIPCPATSSASTNRIVAKRSQGGDDNINNNNGSGGDDDDVEEEAHKLFARTLSSAESYVKRSLAPRDSSLCCAPSFECRYLTRSRVSLCYVSCLLCCLSCDGIEPPPAHLPVPLHLCPLPHVALFFRRKNICEVWGPGGGEGRER